MTLANPPHCRSLDAPSEPPAGAAIVVVSGLPRSGTSLMMRMLAAGGMGVLTDGVRAADEDNPRGYFELERVKSLATDSDWLGAARGKAVKVVSALLQHLPGVHRYRVLFMQRDLGEVLESQTRMLEHRGANRSPRDARLEQEYVAHLLATERFLRGNPAFEVLDVSYRSLCTAPAPEVERVASFIGGALDREAMIGCVEPSLYRVRGTSR